ncbi:sulfatase [Natrinema ejinorense]|uniref:Sulfatase N-terminal domain-containing protein n=1 Tax=Natrinema ejinorense TaxID=373386 RepID=A0A2A5QUL7_9EURY|nr:sulfatase [Natrinema ejinorense]PCR90473.1 hypothetical protein CP557_08005 [Natrinema ejinorense]
MPTDSESQSPNVIFLVSDAARARNFSAYGYDRPTSPNLEQIASESTLYTNAIATAPWTVPSHASMFTGVYTSKHHATRSSPSIRSDLNTLPELLQREGYKTYCITANHLLASNNGLNDGFDETYITTRLFPTNTKYGSVKSSFAENGFSTTFLSDIIEFVRNEGSFRDVANLGYKFAVSQTNGDIVGERRRTPKGSEGNVKKLVDIMESGNEPFFTYLNFMETHLKYLPPKEHFLSVAPTKHSDVDYSDVNQDPRLYNYAKAVEMSEEDFALLQSFYDGTIRHTDYLIGKLYRELSERDLLENTMFIVVGDHGENLGDFGQMGHSLALNDAVVRVPLLISYPKSTDFVTVDSLVQTHDLFPTILETSGVSIELDSLLGQDSTLLPRHSDDPGREYAIAEYLGSPFDGIKRIMQKYPETDYDQYDFEIKTIYDNDGMKLTVKSTGERRLATVDIDGEEPIEDGANDISDKLEEELFETVESFGKIGTVTHYDEGVEDTLRDLGYI